MRRGRVICLHNLRYYYPLITRQFPLSVLRIIVLGLVLARARATFTVHGAAVVSVFRCRRCVREEGDTSTVDMAMDGLDRIEAYRFS
jgi:hypothetical protein